MRGLGLVGVVLALLIVGLLVKKQLQVVAPPMAPLPTAVGEPPGAPGSPSSGPAAAGTTVREQSRQTQDSVRRAVEAGMQQARPIPDDK